MYVIPFVRNISKALFNNSCLRGIISLIESKVQLSEIGLLAYYVEIKINQFKQTKLAYNQQIKTFRSFKICKQHILPKVAKNKRDLIVVKYLDIVVIEIVVKYLDM